MHVGSHSDVYLLVSCIPYDIDRAGRSRMTLKIKQTTKTSEKHLMRAVYLRAPLIDLYLPIPYMLICATWQRSTPLTKAHNMQVGLHAHNGQ